MQKASNKLAARGVACEICGGLNGRAHFVVITSNGARCLGCKAKAKRLANLWMSFATRENVVIKHGCGTKGKTRISPFQMDFLMKLAMLAASPFNAAYLRYSARVELNKEINARAENAYKLRWHRTDNDAAKARASFIRVEIYRGRGSAAERRVGALLGALCEMCGARGFDNHAYYCGEQY